MDHAIRLARAARRAYSEHQLATHAAAISFNVLVALVPLTLLGFALLGAFGLDDVWSDTLAPALRSRLSHPVYGAVNYSVERIFADESAGLLVFSSVLLVWQLTWTARAVATALNAVHEVEERRPFGKRLVLMLGLGVALGVTLIASVLVVTVVPRLASGGLEVALKLGSFLAAAALLSLAVGLLIRYAPAEHPSPRWASAGSVVVVIGWLGFSVAFGWWAGSVADYKNASGNLTVFLFLTAYVLVSSAIFLIGVELDEVARGESGDRQTARRRRATAGR